MSASAGSTGTLELLQRWHSGDQAALTELVRINLAWMQRFVRQRLDQSLRQRVDSIDIVQDAMVQVLEHGPRFTLRDESHFRALLGRIVTNDIQDQHRHAHRQRRDRARERPLDRDSILYLDRPVDSVTRPTQAAERNEREGWVRLGLELLAFEDREVLRMRQWEEASYAEIGAHLGLSADAARMRHGRALKRLGDKVIELRAGSIEHYLRSRGDLD